MPVNGPSPLDIGMHFFLNAMVARSAAVCLLAVGTELAAVAALLMDDAGDSAQAAAMSVLIIGVGLAVRLACWHPMRDVERRTQAWTRAGQEPAPVVGAPATA